MSNTSQQSEAQNAGAHSGVGGSTLHNNNIATTSNNTKAPQGVTKIQEKVQDINEDSSSSTSSSSSEFVSLVQNVFGGKMQTTYKCSNCNSVSLHKEHFTDIHLAIPNQKVVAEVSKLTMQSLLESYLTPETLQGDNQYHCDHCANLQDAVKTMKILEGPDYLMTTLMRFHYDRTQNRKSKVSRPKAWSDQ